MAVENGTSFEVSRWPRLGTDFMDLSPVQREEVAFSFSALPLQPEWAPEAEDVSTMSLKGETELGGMKGEAGRGLKGPEVLGVGGSGSVEGTVAG